MARSRDTLLAFLLGVAAGGIAALLLAPASGKETRRKIRETSEDVYRRGRDSVEKVGEQVGLRARHLGDSAKHQVDAVKGAVSEGKEAYRREMGKHEG
ncbi:MAG: YtxH domain-containing protein [Candidatus Eisenbacteria bacterium]